MRRFLSVIILLFSSLTIGLADSPATAEQGDSLSHLRVSLLTCSSGSTLSAAFGHSALRVCDSVRNADLVFNYGTFNFDGLNFLWNFVKGRMDYFLSISDFGVFTYHYSRQGRSIAEQELVLTERQKEDVYSFLLNNYKPQNRYYPYDFFNDNCATRIRDIFEGEDFAVYDAPTSFTIRKELRRSLADSKWLMFGIDLLLGEHIDRKISARRQMFLPDRLSENMGRYGNRKIGEASVLGGMNVIVPVPESKKGRIADFFAEIFQPAVIFILLFLACLILFLKLKNKEKFIRIFRLVFYIILGTGGAILAFMWFGTHHVWTKMNWNLLWMNPLYLLPLFFRSKKASAIIGNVLTAISFLSVIFSWLIPQTFNLAAIFIILLECEVAVFYYTIVSNKSNGRRGGKKI